MRTITTTRIATTRITSTASERGRPSSDAGGLTRAHTPTIGADSAAMHRLLACLLFVFCTSAAAQGWPTRAVRVIVPFPAGSSPDLVARVITEPLSAVFGQPFVVENRPGAGGNIGTAAIARAAPDGYTIGLSIPGPLAVNTVLYAKLDYDPFRDLAPVSLVAFSPNVLLVDPRLGVTTLDAFIDAVKRQPGRLNYASVGNGSASHLTMELLKQRAGLDLVHVPYPGSPQVIAALMNGQVAAGFIVPAAAMAQVQAGRLVAIAATSAGRSAVLPDLPTIAEQGFAEFQSTSWLGMVAPAGTPAPTIGRLSAEVLRVLRLPEVRQRLHALYFEPVGTAPETLAALMRDERDRWATIIRKTGAKVD
jgi:tripartite-type tricarboxylate transporter receptor subunit TctC